MNTGFDALGLSAPTLEGLARLGFGEPTDVQAQSIPGLIEGRDALIQAPTGSGKTAAFVIPIAEYCLRSGEREKPLALVLCPTRELATQGRDVAAELVEPHGFKTACLIGGVGYAEQRSQLARKPQIIFGSPGRITDGIWEGRVDVSQIGIVVIDEADQLLDEGFAPEVIKILSYLPKQRQTVLVSATLPGWVQEMLDHELHDPIRVSVARDVENDGVIAHHMMETTEARRFVDLCELIDSNREGTVIVFGRTKWGVQKLERQLRQAGYDTEPLQGNMTQGQRERALGRFRDGKATVLVATNVAARGLDVRHVGMVINYELPESADLLTHRIGRTGRMGSDGIAVTLITPADERKWKRLRNDGAPDLRRVSTWTDAERHMAATAPARSAGPRRGRFAGPRTARRRP